MNTDPVAVRCEGLIKHYDIGEQRVTALSGVDLDILKGELTMLVGPSGCGKTTLISVMAGILDQDQGLCEVFGQDIRHMRSKDKLNFRARNIGFVFQSYNLLPTLTAAENVAVPLIINGEKRRQAQSKAEAVLGHVGLGERAASMPAQLSGGQQQRVAIARALVHDPRLIVCDEPTSALDHETGHQVMEILKNIAQNKDRALVIDTHDARIFGFADRIAKMDDGRIEKLVTSPEDL